MIRDGFLYQGQPSRYWGRLRGTKVTDEPASAFVVCIQNHDQVGNRATGERLNHAVDAERYAVASALLLLVPETPLLFMGQEFAASSPFLYFTDHHPDLRPLVTEGRRNEFRHFSAFRDPAMRERIPDPQDPETFRRSKLNLDERRRNAGVYRLYRDLLRLRKSDPVLAVQDPTRLQTATPSDQIVAVLRTTDAGQRPFIANFGPPVQLSPAELPLCSSLPATGWRLLLTTTARRYGGCGQRPQLRGRGRAWQLSLPARCGVLFCLPGL